MINLPTTAGRGNRTTTSWFGPSLRIPGHHPRPLGHPIICSEGECMEANAFSKAVIIRWSAPSCDRYPSKSHLIFSSRDQEMYSSQRGASAVQVSQRWIFSVCVNRNQRRGKCDTKKSLTTSNVACETGVFDGNRIHPLRCLIRHFDSCEIVLIPGFLGSPIQDGGREFSACSLIRLLCRLRAERPSALLSVMVRTVDTNGVTYFQQKRKYRFGFLPIMDSIFSENWSTPGTDKKRPNCESSAGIFSGLEVNIFAEGSLSTTVLCARLSMFQSGHVVLGVKIFTWLYSS